MRTENKNRKSSRARGGARKGRASGTIGNPGQLLAVLVVALLLLGGVLFLWRSGGPVRGGTGVSESGMPHRPLPPPCEWPGSGGGAAVPEPEFRGGGPDELGRMIASEGLGLEYDAEGRLWKDAEGVRRIRHPFRLSGKHVFLVCQPGGEAGRYHGLFGGGPRNYDNFVAIQFAGKSLQISGETAKGGMFRVKVPPHPSVKPGPLCSFPSPRWSAGNAKCG